MRSLWRHARPLLLGAILAPGIRTVASVLRILGLARERRFWRYHRVLSRAAWSPPAASRLLLGLLGRAFVPTGPLVVGIDDTVERGRGKRIRAKGIYRDPVRSSHSHFVKASGLRWLSVMLLAPIPWAGRVWALPFLTALAPSPRYRAETGHRHKQLTDWARQLLRQVRRWLPGRTLVVVADSSYTALDLLAAPPRDERAPVAERRAAPAPLGRAHRSRDSLAACHGGRLVRRGGAHDRARHRHGRVAPPRPAARAAARDLPPTLCRVE